MINNYFFFRTNVFTILFLLSISMDMEALPKLLKMPEPPPLNKVVPIDFKLVKDDKALRRISHQSLGIGLIFGKPLVGYEGFTPWLITKCWDGVLPGMHFF
jgi:hypothetical protein